MKILAFSGGKDSLACLKLMSDQLSDITVVWVNTGAYFEEDVLRIRETLKTVPHYIEIETTQEEQIKENGYPVDLLPLRHDREVQFLTGEKKPFLQSFLKCCASNISMPLHFWAVKNGVTEIIRGQKNTDHFKTSIKDGDVIDGITYRFPIQSWTDEEVKKYLGESLPKNYKYTDGGLDCWNCTAYLHDSKDKMEYMKEFHPEKYQEVSLRLTKIKVYIDDEYKHLAEVLNV